MNSCQLRQIKLPNRLASARAAPLPRAALAQVAEPAHVALLAIAALPMPTGEAIHTL